MRLGLRIANGVIWIAAWLYIGISSAAFVNNLVPAAYWGQIAGMTGALAFVWWITDLIIRRSSLRYGLLAFLAIAVIALAAGFFAFGGVDLRG
jgi:hypothetical protein